MQQRVASTADDQPDRRRLLVAAALELLEANGPEAMTTRKIAARVGTSSMAVYTDFGSMGGLVAAVVQEGFDQLASAMRAVPVTADPVADLWRLALAAREFARHHHHLYAVMFAAQAPGGYRRTGDELLQGIETFQALVEFSRRAIDSGRVTAAEPLPVAIQLWMVFHGMIMLELAGYLELHIRPRRASPRAGLHHDRRRPRRRPRHGRGLARRTAPGRQRSLLAAPPRADARGPDRGGATWSARPGRSFEGRDRDHLQSDLG